jgi:NAD(P)-dependent dehydrogenase (short-subunit alcohol dehydrogenase family)
MAKTWFITGSARGIGAEIVKAALAAGDQVVATGRNTAPIEKTFGAHGDRVLALALDVTSEAQAVTAAEAAVKRFRRIDVLVNNAGYGLLGAFEENVAKDIEQQYQTNVFGLMHVTRAVLPVMRKQRAGHIFNLSSIGGIVGYPCGSIYCSTKFAIEGFSESLALEVTQFGIHITIVEPGFFRTDFLDSNSIKYGDNTIADYAELGAQMRAVYNGANHKQPGDPAKLGAAMVKLASMDKPPLRYAAGTDAVDGIVKKLTSMRGEVDTWRELSVSTDHA